MNKIVIKEGFGFVYLNRNFYDKSVVLNTLVVYEEFFRSSLSEIGNYFVVRVDRIDESYSVEELLREFSNYLINGEYGLLGGLKSGF